MKINQRDESQALLIIEGLLQQYPEAAVVAFSLREITSKFTNTPTRSTRPLVEALNDMLSSTYACQRLGTVATLCEYEMDTYFLIRANKAVSLTDRFNPLDLTFPQAK